MAVAVGILTFFRCSVELGFTVKPIGLNPLRSASSASQCRCVGLPGEPRRFLNVARCANPARVVFLGSPGCVCPVLRQLKEGEKDSAETAPYEVVAVVTQQPSVQGKKKILTKTAVHELAEELEILPVMTPASARDEDFLTELEELNPDLCITAAYGQYLPKRFLRTPRLGTLNLHPSLLPRWRGASPVQRALVAGDDVTGMSILYTVTKMDAGPLVAQSNRRLVGNETSPLLLEELFTEGGETLVKDVLPDVLSGKVTQETATSQSEDGITAAPLIKKSEGKLWPHNETAVQMRNKVRGFTGWPGTTLPVACSGSEAPPQLFRIKVWDAEIMPASQLRKEDLNKDASELIFVAATDEASPAIAIRPSCDEENVLLLRTWQIPGKKAEPAATFNKGYMTAQPARWLTPDEELELAAKPAPKKKTRR